MKQWQYMRTKFLSLFLISSGLLLAFTGSVKIISACGSSKFLNVFDPVFHISSRHLFLLAGTIELIIAAACFFGAGNVFKVALLAWLATVFLGYRLTLAWLGYHKPCSCLGNLTDALHIPPQAADSAMKCVLYPYS